jgi:S-formylglutathione hydrolase
MGGHGALTVGLRNPERFKAVTAFAPITSTINCPWGQKAMAGYLGDDQSKWEEYDACALIKNGARLPDILVDQGSADEYIETELKPDLLRDACAAAGQPLTLRIHEGYNHGYYFVSSFMKDHLEWHAERL